MTKKKKLLWIVFGLFCLIYIGFIGYSMISTKIGNAPELTLPQTVLSVDVKADDHQLLQDIKAVDKEDGDLTDKVFIESISSFNENKERTVTYGVFDSDDHLVKATRQIKYTDYQEPTITLKGADGAENPRRHSPLDDPLLNGAEALQDLFFQIRYGLQGQPEAVPNDARRRKSSCLQFLNLLSVAL